MQLCLHVVSMGPNVCLSVCICDQMSVCSSGDNVTSVYSCNCVVRDWVTKWVNSGCDSIWVGL